MSDESQEFRGKIGKMSDQEVAEFLHEPHPIEIACLKPDGSPYITVAWQQWEDEAFWLVARERSLWAEYMKEDPRVSYVVHQWDPMVKISGEGLAEIVEEPNVGGRWTEIADRMALRYLGPDGPAYLVPTLGQPRWLIKMKPTTMKTWQGVAWARRYWVETGSGPSYEQAMGLEP